MPLGDPLTKAHIVPLKGEHTVRPFPPIDALGKSNIYRNVMAWQPSIKLVITEPIQKRDRKEGMPGMMSARRTEACKQLFSDCLRFSGISSMPCVCRLVTVTIGRNTVGTHEIWPAKFVSLMLKDDYTTQDWHTVTCCACRLNKHIGSFNGAPLVSVTSLLNYNHNAVLEESLSRKGQPGLKWTCMVHLQLLTVTKRHPKFNLLWNSICLPTINLSISVLWSWSTFETKQKAERGGEMWRRKEWLCNTCLNYYRDVSM